MRGRKTPPQGTHVCNILTLTTHRSLRFPSVCQAGEAEPRSVIYGCTGPGPEGRPQRPVSLSPGSILLVLPLLQMGSPMQKTALPCLSLILLIWSQGPGVQGQEFQFGPCRVEGVVFQELWEASRAMKDIVVSEVSFWTQLLGLLWRGEGDNSL